jgi:hypothetical protein
VISVSRVTPEAIRRELRRLGFEEVELNRGGATWMDPSNASRPAVLVPPETDQSRSGYGELLESAIQRLSWLLETDPPTTIERLAEPGDRFELRMVDRTTAGGRLPLLKAPVVIVGFLQIIRAGARAEFRGTQANYSNNDPLVVREALAGLDLLAPAEGSFRLIAASAVEAQLPLDRKTAIPDHSRRSLAAAARGLRTAAQVTEEPLPKPDTDLTPAIHEGLSATLLGGIAKIAQSAPDLSIEFNAKWDPSLPAVDAPPGEVVLDPPQLRRVAPLAKRLRQRPPEPHRIVQGWVKTAEADELAAAGGHPTGLIVVEALIEKSKKRVLIEVPSGIFEKLRPGLSEIRAKGDLKKVGIRWHLIDPQEIAIVRR